MGSRNRNRNRNGFYSDRYWQSADFNRRSFAMYRDWIISLAVNRFKWENLPSTCDERFLEWTLLTEGCATIASKKLSDGTPSGIWTSNKAVQQGVPNVYDNPTRWTAYGNNGWRFDADSKNGAFIWENRLRRPILPDLELFARRLAALDRTMDVNLQHQFTPYLITVPQEQRDTAINLYKQIAGGEPAILANDSMSMVNIDVIKTDVPFIGQELQTEKQNMWNEVYTFLGIDNLPTKAERMIQEEVLANDQPSDIRALDGLTARREAVDKLNRRFGLDIQVHWNQDYISDNWNLTHDIASIQEVSDDGTMD